MNAIQRREKIVNLLYQSNSTLNASILAEQLQVSRQVIVSDIALLRAKGHDILSTPRGYVIDAMLAEGDVLFKIACLHSSELTRKEIYTIVDNGGKLMDVIVEHPIYGQLVGQLNIASRYDANDFLKKVEEEDINLLCELTGGIHLHTILCKDEQSACRIRDDLQELNILLT